MFSGYLIVSCKGQTLKDSSLGRQDFIVDSLVFVFHGIMFTRSLILLNCFAQVGVFPWDLSWSLESDHINTRAFKAVSRRR